MTPAVENVIRQRILQASDRLVFISDVHLGAHSDTKNRSLEQALIHLIDECEKLQFRIVVLGDLYDFWMEYKNRRPLLGNRVMTRFQRFHESNPATIYILGNHDCWMQDYHQNLGFDLETEFRVLKTSQANIFVHHGDGLSNNHFGLKRSLLNRTLRNEMVIRLYQFLLPPGIGLKTMKKFSAFNKVIDDNIPEPEKLDSWTENLFQMTPINAVVSGHDHLERIKNSGENIYLNCGAFFDNHTIGLYNRNSFQLVSLKEKTLQEAVNSNTD